MKTIIVTGGSGLVGSALKDISQNFSKNYKFIFLNSKMCNLLDYNQTLNFFIENKPDYIIHLAANVGGLFKNMEYPVQMLEDNILINTNVLKVAHNLNVKKLIACLSTCIFPDNISYPINESDLHKGPPHNSNAAYAYAKRLLEVHCEAYNKQYNHNFTCIVPTNIYGPNDNFNLNNAHVIPALIHKCFLAKQTNSKFIISGSGKPLRQFIYSKNLAEMIMLLIENNKNVDTSIILSPDENSEVSIEYIARTIAKEFDYEEFIDFDLTKSDGQYKKTVSNNKFRNTYPDYKFINIEDGIKSTVNWFKNNYPNIRI